MKNSLLVIALLSTFGAPALATTFVAAAPTGPSSPRASAPAGPGLPPGLYVQVLDGTIHVANAGGTQNFSAGQFGYTPGLTTPPVVLPRNPGLAFAPPPAFQAAAAAPSQPGAANSNSVDCEVR